ncbi:MAG: mechanosensitive ion channel family protein [Kangiellaceae bacterium]
MDWLQKSFQDYFSKDGFIQEYLPFIAESRVVQAILLFLLGLLIAEVVEVLINRIQKHATKRTSTPIDDHLFEKLKRPVKISILLLSFRLAFARLGIFSEQIAILDSMLLTVAIFYWLRFIINSTHFILHYLSGHKGKVKIIQKHTLPLFDNFAAIVLYGLGLYFILIAWNINISAWVASAGILGLALSFAAKDTLANLFAGVFILADNPYKLGDFIVLESGERGEVTHIGIRSTRILTRDDVEITVPNAIMGNTKIINETAGPHKKYRIRIRVSAAYGEPIEKVRNALLDVAEKASNIERTPEPRVRFRTFGESGLNFELLCWVAEPVLRGRVSDSLNEAVYNKFIESSIEIPYPKRDIYVHQK